MLRDEIINDLRSFRVFRNEDMLTFNIDDRLYLVRDARWLKTILIIDREQDNKVIYYNSLLADYPNISNVLDYLIEAYNLDEYYKKPREYMEEMFNLLKGQMKEGYIITRNPDDKLVTYLASRNVKLYFDSRGKLALIRLLSKDEFFNPNSILNGAAVTIYIDEALVLSTDLKNLIK